jgi:hypothetical protein
MVYQLVHDLPDTYAKPVRYREKDTVTNTWRLFALIEQQSKQFLDEVQSQANQLDISQCTGSALDAMGEMYHREKATLPTGRDCCVQSPAISAMHLQIQF